MTELKYLTLTALALAALICAAMCAGCAHVVTPSAERTAAGTATGQLQAAHADLAAVKTHAPKDPYVQARTESADESIVSVLALMPTFEAAADALQKAQAQIAEWNQWWFGPRAHRAFWTVITIMGALGVLQIILFFVAGTSPVGIWKAGAAIFGRIIGIFVPVFGAVANWIHAHVTKKEAVKQATLSASGIIIDPQPPV